MAAFNFSRPNRQIILARGLVIQLIRSFGQIAIGGLHRSFWSSFGLLMGTQRAQHFAQLVVEQASLLAVQPGFGLPGTHARLRRRQIIAHVIKVHQVSALLAKVAGELFQDPPGAVAQAMHPGLRVQPRGPGDLLP